MSEETQKQPDFVMEQIQRSDERNFIHASCEIQRIRTEEGSIEQSIWISVDTVLALQASEGDIRQRIAELLNKCIRGLENP